MVVSQIRVGTFGIIDPKRSEMGKRTQVEANENPGAEPNPDNETFATLEGKTLKTQPAKTEIIVIISPNKTEDNPPSKKTELRSSEFPQTNPAPGSSLQTPVSSNKIPSDRSNDSKVK
mmetsp:Transcript_1730/g.3803  ORF Transcript_1730/g.3803 Transcript_1730/m.3803 type:complete len:118 (-) Transcript_1730:255-608(-)